MEAEAFRLTASKVMSTEPCNDITRYSYFARLFHGTSAVIIVFIVAPVGVWIHYFEPADQAFKMRLYNIHESFGFIIFGLTLLRLAWRWIHPPPVWPDATPVWIKLASGFSHASLYALLLLMPITGFLATNAWGFPLKLFEYLPIPSPIGKDEILAKFLSLLHWCCALCMCGVLFAHLLGALNHRFIARDSLARRMI